MGATLYCLLTGRPPVSDADLGRLIARVTAGDFRRPRDVAPDVPGALEAICLKAMSREPSKRYESTGALAADVERWLADEPVTAWTEPLLTRTRRWIKRHQTIVTTAAATIVVAALCLAGVVVVVTSYAQRQVELKRDAEEARTRAVEKQKEADAQRAIAQDRKTQV